MVSRNQRRGWSHAPAPALAVFFLAAAGSASGASAGPFPDARPSSIARQTEAEAARRRLEILRSPYTELAGRRNLRGGEVVLAWEARIPSAFVSEVAEVVEPALSALFDRDGFPRPCSAADPLVVNLVGGPSASPASAGWEGRTRSRLLRPVIGVSVGSRRAATVAGDVVRAAATLSLRQSGSPAPGWLVEGMSEWLAQRALGIDGAAPSAFLATRGSLLESDACAAFLAELAARLPRGVEAIRQAWDERTEEPVAFLRRLAALAAPGGLPEVLGQLVVRAIAFASPGELGPGPLVVGEEADSVSVPGPLGWVRESFSCIEEGSGGLEVSFGGPQRVRTGRGLVVYRGEEGEHDAVALDPSESRIFPLAGVASLALVLVDGDGDGEMPLRLRRVPGYPVAMASSSAVWDDGAVHVSWRTAAHTDLLAWVVARYEDDGTGRPRLAWREVVPTTTDSDGGFSYHVLDRDVPPGTSCRYRVSALTRDGLVALAFEAPVVAGR